MSFNLEFFLKNIYWKSFTWEFTSKQKGEWYDIDEFKEYQLWDNVKRINWKLSAKYDKEYVSVYKVEKEPILDIFLDVNYNFNYFEKDLKSYFYIINLLCKKFWIKPNIYTVLSWNLVKLWDFHELKKNKKWNLKLILNSTEFKKKFNYKILISDFLFVSIEELDKLVLYKKNLFVWILPIYDLLKNGKFPIKNWFFNNFFFEDFLYKYNKKLIKAQECSFLYDKIMN